MKSSEALRLARELIKRGQEQYVCLALSHVGGKDTAVYRRIRAAVGSSMSVVAWLHSHSDDAREFFDTTLQRGAHKEFAAAARAYRLRWIDWMIEGYTAKGD